MLSEEIINSICEYANGNYKKTSRELVIRCPYCGDSNDIRKKHLYVQIDNGEYGFMYHCFKCNASGTLTKLLRDIGRLNINYATEIRKQTKNKNSHRYIELKKNYTFDILQNKIDSKKLEYVKTRLNLTEVPKFITDHIITDFDYIDERIINDKMKKTLNECYIGFRTFNKRKIICRNITQNKSLNRYIIVDTNDKQPDYFMTTNGEFDVLNPGKIIIAEGVFTVLGGYFKLHDKIKMSNYILVGGAAKSYLKATLFTTYNFGIPDWQIYILADTDVKKDYLKNDFEMFKNKKTIKVLYCDKKDFADDWTNYSIENLF